MVHERAPKPEESMSKDHLPEGNELNQYTRSVIEHGISRRRLLSGTVAGAGGLRDAGTERGTRRPQPRRTPAVFGKSSDGHATLSFLPKAKPIAEKAIQTTLTFDVIVVGAGAAGVPAALSAAENGAKVAVIQKAPFALSQGNNGGRDRRGQDRQSRRRGAGFANRRRQLPSQRSRDRAAMGVQFPARRSDG